MRKVLGKYFNLKTINIEKMRHALLILMTMLVTSCGFLYLGHDPHDLCVQNNSATKIAYYFPSACDYPMDEFPCNAYPDTTITFPWWFASGPVMPNEKLMANHGLIEGAYIVYNADTLSLFILDSRLLEGEVFIEEDSHWENDAWYKAMEETDVLARYDLSWEDIQSFRDDKGIVTLYYPPTPEMKHIKMWPPYEEAIKNAESLRP